MPTMNVVRKVKKLYKKLSFRNIGFLMTEQTTDDIFVI